MSGVQTIERAFAVLRALAAGRSGVTDIAERTDLPKSTVSRLLSALESENIVRHTDSGTDYELADGLRELADSIGPDASLAAAVRPVLVELRDAVGESAGFTVRVGRDVYWVGSADQVASVQVQDRTGHYARMHTVASGLAMLARLEAGELDRYLDEPLEKLNDRTLTDPAALRVRLQEIRDAGVLWSFEELEEGLSSVSAAFRSPSGKFDAALYIEGPSFRFPSEGDQERVEKLVREAADQLSERFEYH